jgi:DNA replication protein DnaC
VASRADTTGATRSPPPTTGQNRSSNSCPWCKGSGLTAASLGGSRERAPGGWFCLCRAGRQALERHQRAARSAGIERLFGASRIPTRFAELDLDTFPQQHRAQREALEVCRHFVEHGIAPDGREGLLFVGPYGRGKTGLAIATLRERIRRGDAGIFTTTVDLMDAIYASLERDAEVKHRELLEMVTGCDVLVLDDLGREHPTDFVNVKLFQVVNARHDWMRRTIFTTNLDGGAQLPDRLGQPIYQRIVEMATIVSFPKDSPNLRAGGR